MELQSGVRLGQSGYRQVGSTSGLQRIGGSVVTDESHFSVVVVVVESLLHWGNVVAGVDVVGSHGTVVTVDPTGSTPQDPVVGVVGVGAGGSVVGTGAGSLVAGSVVVSVVGGSIGGQVGELVGGLVVSVVGDSRGTVLGVPRVGGGSVEVGDQAVVVVDGNVVEVVGRVVVVLGSVVVGTVLGSVAAANAEESANT